MEDLSGLRRNLVDTPDTDDEIDLRLGGDVEVTRGPRSTSEADFFLLLRLVLLDVRLCALENDFALRFLCLAK